MNNYKISVIVPLYNTSCTMDKCIQSIIEQTYNNLEIILVENGSTDNTYNKCCEWQKKDNRIKVYQSEKGVSNARNLGLDVMTGDYFAFVDSDDYIDCKMYEKLIYTAQKENADMTFCKYYDVFESNILQKKDKEDLDQVVKHNIGVFINEHKPVMASIWRILYKSNTLRHIRFDSSIILREDLQFVIKAVSAAVKITYIDDALYYYTFPIDFNSKYYDDGFIEREAYTSCELIKLFDPKIYAKEIAIEQFATYKRVFLIALRKKNYKQLLNKINSNPSYKIMNNRYSYKAYTENLSLKQKLLCFIIRHKLSGILIAYFKLRKAI